MCFFSLCTYRYVRMYVITLAILIDEPAEKFVHAGIEYLKAFVILRKDFLQCFDFLL